MEVILPELFTKLNICATVSKRISKRGQEEELKSHMIMTGAGEEFDLERNITPTVQPPHEMIKSL